MLCYLAFKNKFYYLNCMCVCVCVLFCTFAHVEPLVHNAFLRHAELSTLSTPTSYFTFLWQISCYLSYVHELQFQSCLSWRSLFILPLMFGYLCTWLSHICAILEGTYYLCMYLGCLYNTGCIVCNCWISYWIT